MCGGGVLGSRTRWADLMGLSNSESGGGLWRDRQGVGTPPPRPVVPTEKCRGPGSSPLMRPAAEQAGGGGAARAAHARRGGERPDCPVAESSPRVAESAGTPRRGGCERRGPTEPELARAAAAGPRGRRSR